MTKQYNCEIYSIAALKTAIVAYSQICSITLIDNGNYYTCKFSCCKFNETETGNEFDNYVICAMSKEG